LGFHGKSGGEHFWQHDQVGARGLLQQQLEMLQVGLAVMPGQGGLYQGDIQVG